MFDPELGEILFFSGQRDDKYLQDVVAYNVHTDIVTELQPDCPENGNREASFGQKTAIDSELKEIYTYELRLRHWRISWLIVTTASAA